MKPLDKLLYDSGTNLRFMYATILRSKIIFLHPSKIRSNRMLRKGVYAISTLLGNRGKAHEEVNRFKDELTDYSKYKSRGLSM